MTGLGHLVAQALRQRREFLEQALAAIRDYQTAVVALTDLPEATPAAREWALATAQDLQAAWSALDRIRWANPPFPGTRDT